MAKPFKELRKLMYAEGIDQRSLARQLGKGTTYVSSRGTCWTFMPCAICLRSRRARSPFIFPART